MENEVEETVSKSVASARAFVASISMIIVSELGDKASNATLLVLAVSHSRVVFPVQTFFVAALMAMRFNKMEGITIRRLPCACCFSSRGPVPSSVRVGDVSSGNHDGAVRCHGTRCFLMPKITICWSGIHASQFPAALVDSLHGGHSVRRFRYVMACVLAGPAQSCCAPRRQAVEDCH